MPRATVTIWSFEAQAGQELVFVLVGPGLGSSLNARLTLIAAAASNWRASLGSRGNRRSSFASVRSGGKFYLRIEDRDYTGGGNHFYYIHAGAFPYITNVYPLGMKAADAGPLAGDEVQAVEVLGANIPAERKSRRSEETGTRFIPLDTPAGKTLNTARYESSSLSRICRTRAERHSRRGAAYPGAQRHLWKNLSRFTRCVPAFPRVVRTSTTSRLTPARATG